MKETIKETRRIAYSWEIGGCLIEAATDLLVKVEKMEKYLNKQNKKGLLTWLNDPRNVCETSTEKALRDAALIWASTK